MLKQSYSTTILLLTSWFLVLISCIEDPAPGGETGGKSGYLTGKVSDPQDKPLGSAIIYTDNKVIKGRGSEVKSASDGAY